MNDDEKTFQGMIASTSDHPPGWIEWTDCSPRALMLVCWKIELARRRFTDKKHRKAIRCLFDALDHAEELPCEDRQDAIDAIWAAQQLVEAERMASRTGVIGKQVLADGKVSEKRWIVRCAHCEEIVHFGEYRTREIAREAYREHKRIHCPQTGE